MTGLLIERVARRCPSVMAVQRRRPTLKMNPRRESGDAELHKPRFFVVGGGKWHVTPMDYSGSGGRTFVRRSFCCTFFEVGVFFKGWSNPNHLEKCLGGLPWAHPGTCKLSDGDVFQDRNLTKRKPQRPGPCCGFLEANREYLGEILFGALAKSFFGSFETGDGLGKPMKHNEAI